MNKKNFSFSFFLAWRYLCAAESKSTLSTMIRICFFSIIIGSFALTLVSAVMQGFESALHEKLRGIHSHLIMQTTDQELAIDAITDVIAREFPEVSATALSITQHALLYASHTEGAPLMAFIKGINPVQEQKNSCLESKIIAGPTELEKIIHNNHVLIGKEMAHQLEVTIGDVITIAYSDNLSHKTRTITFDTQELVVGGIFETGLDDVDTHYLFCDYRLVQKLFDNAEISTLHINLYKGCDEDIIAKKIEQRFNIPTYSWKSLYPTIIATLALEKYAMFFILALITLVASANIIALLFMLIMQKKSDIALLRTLGASHSVIRAIFIIIGSIIAQSACLIGVAFAWLISFFMNHYHLITLPDGYYTSYLRADMSMTISCIVFALVSIITLGATLIATKNMSKGNIAQIMRN